MTENFPKDTALQRVYREFAAMVAGDDATIDLAQATLLIAAIRYPDLDRTALTAQLDLLARRVRTLLALSDTDTLPELPPELDLLTVIDAMNTVLIDEEHFHGNREDYDNPNNSCFNKVLEDHTGLPITLSLLYMEVGKRVGLQIEGIGLPYHFMVRCRLPEGMIYIDPFDAGRLFNEQQCKERIRQLTKNRVKIQAHWFEPVTHRQFLARVLNNLKRLYINREEPENALVICDFMIMLLPNAPTERRDRGIVHFQLEHYAHALHDLTAYVRLQPQAEDYNEISNHIKFLRQTIAMMN